MGRVENRVAVVTGAANGLGQAIARRLAEEGARMVLGDLEADGLERTAACITDAGGTAVTVVGDLTEEDAAARLIQTAVDRHGHLDILVNNVGGSRTAKIWEMRVEDWDFVLRLNLRSTFLCTRYAVPHMMQQRSGKIVCLSSGAREGTPWNARVAHPRRRGAVDVDAALVADVEVALAVVGAAAEHLPLERTQHDRLEAAHEELAQVGDPAAEHQASGNTADPFDVEPRIVGWGELHVGRHHLVAFVRRVVDVEVDAHGDEPV